ncbi:hypothetical protein BSKO_01636 [Bryopsis sp. KO-2023]|nr:hypothetical protein BSKO_01636 [Bryopsis sp. KO-2023]
MLTLHSHPCSLTAPPINTPSRRPWKAIPGPRRVETVCRAKTVRSPETKGTKDAKAGDRFYFNITGFPFPLGPFFDRKTIRKEIVKGKIWTFDQPQSLEFSTVTINIRMTVVKLESGGLWVHSPIAPTKECLNLLKELDAPIEYIILPTFAYEHKIFVGPFSRKFPKAQVYVAPSQWSWPINLPPQFFGIFPDAELKDKDMGTPWADEIDQKVFRPPDVGIGPYVECMFYHKASKTLIVTDIVVYIPSTPLEIVPTANLLDQAKDNGLNTFLTGDMTKEEVKAKTVPGEVDDTPANRKRGWMRTALLVLYFGPYNLLQPQASFRAIADKWIVSPVIRILVYSRIPKSVTKWIDEIESDWDFTSVIPCHFAGPVKARPGDLSQAFAFSYIAAGTKPRVGGGGGIFGFLKPPEAALKDYIPASDLARLNSLNDTLNDAGVVYSDLE